MRQKKCKYSGCGKLFTPSRPLQAVCDWRCSLAYTEEKKQKEIRREIRRRKEQLKRRADWVSEAQSAFNAYVRFRDISSGYGCIDCGKPFEASKRGGSVDAGHYLSRGTAPHLRFDERNVFAQRKNCNRPGGATRDAFRKGVIARIGLEAVEALEADQAPRKWTVEQLKEIRDTYRAKLKALKKERETDASNH